MQLHWHSLWLGTFSLQKKINSKWGDWNLFIISTDQCTLVPTVSNFHHRIIGNVAGEDPTDDKLRVNTITWQSLASLLLRLCTRLLLANFLLFWIELPRKRLAYGVECYSSFLSLRNYKLTTLRAACARLLAY